MKTPLHTARHDASFCACWYLVPFALCVVAFVALVVAQALSGGGDAEVEANAELQMAAPPAQVPVAAPAPDAHGT